MPVLKAQQNALFAVFNIVFMAAVMPLSSLAFIAGFLLLGYGVIALKARFKTQGFSVLLLALLTLFILFKKYEFIPDLIPPLAPLYEQIPVLVGLSYIIFRLVALLFEAHEKGKLPGPLAFFNYTASFLTFLSGPIQRYKDFREDSDALHASAGIDDKTSGEALSRLVNGAIKVMLLAPIFQSGMDYITGKLDRAWTPIIPGILPEYDAAIGMSAAVLFFLVYLYFNFAGYTDIAIALGRLCGFSLPENFDKPFMAASFLDFWNHWHISLSGWFKDYVFTPILKISLKAGIKNPVLAMLPAYLISFALIGLWHGRSWPFLFCGAMFALYAVLNHSYREFFAKKMFGKDGYKALKAKVWYLSLCGAATLMAIGIAVIGLWLPGEGILAFLNKTSVSALATGIIVMTLALACLLHFYRSIATMAVYGFFIAKPVKGFFEGQGSLLLAAKVFMLLSCYLAFLSGVPGFVYQGF